MASVFPGGIDSVPDIVNPTVTDCNVAPTLSSRLNLATDAVTAIETWLLNNMGAIFETPGVIKAYAGSTAPSGYLLCNGQAVSRTTFSALFAVCGTKYGAGDGSTTFQVPNFGDRVPIGAFSQPLGAFFGNNLAALSTANLPAHSHPVVDPGHAHSVNDGGHAHTIADPGHVHGVADPGHAHSYVIPTSTTALTGTGVFASNANSTLTGTSTTNITIQLQGTGIGINNHVTGIGVNSAFTGLSTGNTGSGATFSVQNPSLVVNFIIKT